MYFDLHVHKNYNIITPVEQSIHAISKYYSVKFSIHSKLG